MSLFDVPRGTFPDHLTLLGPLNPRHFLLVTYKFDKTFFKILNIDYLRSIYLIR